MDNADNEIEIGSFYGYRRDDGSLIGYDYSAQSWVDSSDCERNPAYPPGTANNPLMSVPGHPNLHR